LGWLKINKEWSQSQLSLGSNLLIAQNFLGEDA
jgi:hypothetical protein